MRLPKALHTRIFLGMVLGVLAGAGARVAIGDGPALDFLVQNVAVPLGQAFLRLIFMVVVPLVLAALALGVAEVGEAGRVGRIGAKTLGFTLIFSGIAVAVGLVAVNLFHPGGGLTEAERQALMAAVTGTGAQEKVAQAAQAQPIMKTLLEFIPQNPVAEAARAFEGGLIPLMVFALVMGMGMAAVGSERAAPLKAFLESLYAVMLKVIDFAMLLAPFGVAGLMFSVTASLGVEAFLLLGKYALVVIGALAFHQVVVYGLGVRLFAGRSPRAYFASLREVMLTAFSTSSSSATLPTALRTATEKLKLPKDVSHFVLTVGATANQNGTALFEGVTVLFLAQLFGVDLSLGQQVQVVLMCVLAGIGTAGVPGGSLPMIVIVLQSIGVPGVAIGIIMGIDRVLDMSRTVLNVTGDLTIATCVAASEGRRDAAPVAAESRDAA